MWTVVNVSLPPETYRSGEEQQAIPVVVEPEGGASNPAGGAGLLAWVQEELTRCGRVFQAEVRAQGDTWDQWDRRHRPE